jgi:hypothetical protein
MILKMKFCLLVADDEKKRTVRRHMLEFSEVWTPWGLFVGWKIREVNKKAMDYIGNDKRKE